MYVHVTHSYKLYVNGAFVEPSSGNWIDSVDPYTGETVSRIPRGTPQDIDAAVEAAHNAAFYDEWSELTATERGRYLHDLADELEERVEKHAMMDVRDNGKPIKEFRGQHWSIPEWFRFYAGLADKIRGATIPSRKDDKEIITKKEPVGVVGAITPWNSPLMLATWKLAPALATGNAVVLKPDEKTSTSSLAFAEALDAVGFPDGAVNIVSGYGDEVGQALVEHRLVDKISFTGGTETGSHIAKDAGKGLKRTTMELGGKNANIVFPDANLDNAVHGATTGVFSAAGQSCSAGSRLLLHEDIYDRFIDRLVDVTAQITLGDPKDSTTDMGPLAFSNHHDTVTEYVKTAKEGGATLIYGGGPPEEDLGSDLFFEPTIFTDVDNDSTIAQEEIFGPVLAVLSFKTEQEAVELANDVRYGLAAGVWTENIRRAYRVADEIRAGRVWINNYRNSDFTAPQGGYKASGWGVENGIEAAEEFLNIKSVWWELSEEPDLGFKLL